MNQNHDDDDDDDDDNNDDDDDESLSFNKIVENLHRLVNGATLVLFLFVA